MSQPSTNPVTLADWASREAIPFDSTSAESLGAAVDRMLAAMGSEVELLGIGEPMHGAGDFLEFRNHFFQRLVKAHGFTAITVESSYPRGLIVNDYIADRSTATSCDDLQDTGFSHGFGRAPQNRALVEWMRGYNTTTKPDRQLHFYGFDSPTEMMWSDSPRRLIELTLNYLASHDKKPNEARRTRITDLLVEDGPWENQEAAYEPAKSIGLTLAAGALRLEVEELVTKLEVRRPELATGDSQGLYLEAVQHATLARQLLTYHACVARPSSTRVADLLGLRDAMMASNLLHILARERGRGRVLAFAHNAHLQRSAASWQFGPQLLEWWPAGAHVSTMLGPQYANIGVGVGTSETFGIAAPESDTLEAVLTGTPGPARFIPTQRGNSFDTADLTALSTRTGSAKNPGYFPFTARSLTDFDWLAVLDSIS